MTAVLIWVGIIITIVYALLLSVVVCALQWIIYPLRAFYAHWFGYSKPDKPHFPPECVCILE